MLALAVAAAWSPASIAAPGLVGFYYNNRGHSGPAALVRRDSTVNFNWGAGSPDPGVNADGFSVRWIGYLRVQTTGNYTFQTYSDETVRLTVNGALLIDNWTDHAGTDTSGVVALTAGVDYAVALEYSENTGNAAISLSWKRPGDSAYSVIPAGDGIQGLATGATPMLEYLFEESGWAGVADEVIDTSYNGYNGTAAGLGTTKPSTAGLTPAVGGATGTCRYGVFNRSRKDYVALPTALPNLGSSGSFSVTAWLRTSDYALPGQRLLIDDENGDASGSIGWILSLGDRGPGRLNFFDRLNGQAAEVITPSVIATGTWYFVAAGVDFATRTKFIQILDTAGTVLSSVSATHAGSSLGVDPGRMSIGGETNSAVGGENTTDFGLSGNLDDVRVYPYALTSADIAAAHSLKHSCGGALLASYAFEDGAWNGSSGELADAAGHPTGPYNGVAQGSPLPTQATSTPARGGAAGTCGYASLPGPQIGGGYFTVSGLPLSGADNVQTTISLWLYWTGTNGVIPVGSVDYSLYIDIGSIGFTTSNGDIFGVPSSGLANGWHHVVAVFVNGNVGGSRLYIDGVKQVMVQRQGVPIASRARLSPTLRIGAYGLNPAAYVFSGSIDEVRIYNYGVNAAEVAALYAESHTCSTLHHVELQHASGSGLTCTPSTLTVRACRDSACTAGYAGGVTGTLAATGSGMTVNWPAGSAFSIPAGSTSISKELQLTTAGNVLLGSTGLSPVPVANTSCNFGSPGCTWSAADAGFLFDVPDHVSDVSQVVSVSAVRRADNALACVPAFANTSKSVIFRCAYANPAGGTLPVRVGGSALNSGNSSSSACDAGGRAVTLAFNASGVASTSVQYADAGQVSLSGSYSGSGSDAALQMSGSDSFVARPASLAVTNVRQSAAPNMPNPAASSATSAVFVKAGEAFSATVTALNGSGAATPNFGREVPPEAVILTATVALPAGGTTGALANATIAGGSFSNGIATVTTLAYGEVGTATLAPALADGSYLGSGNVVGSAVLVGRFVPARFALSAASVLHRSGMSCSPVSVFSYLGETFRLGLTLTAQNQSGGTTTNYAGAFAKLVPSSAPAWNLAGRDAATQFSVANGRLSLGGAYGSFVGGVASNVSLTALAVRNAAPEGPYNAVFGIAPVDSDGVALGPHDMASVQAGANDLTQLAAVRLAYGRLRLSSAMGAADRSLALPAVVQAWNGSAWAMHTLDSCTSVPAGAMNFGNLRGTLTAADTAALSSLVFSAGSGTLRLAAPGGGRSGTLDVALSLGGTSADASCLQPWTQAAGDAATVGAGLPHLRGAWCGTTSTQDPAARASFGLQRRPDPVIYRRENY